jgi:hypothetical protein
MLKEAVKQLMIEGDIPIVWSGMKRSSYVRNRHELDSHRNDGKVSYEQEEYEDDSAGSEDMIDMDSDIADTMGDEDMDHDEFGTLDDEQDDPDRQGLIRVVPNAHLVYKRASEDGTFEELWIYNTEEQFDTELQTRRAILAGTDIEMNQMHSKDGSQSYELWDAGNAQLLKISGLPS